MRAPLLLVGALLAVDCETAQAGADEVLASLTVRPVARDEDPRAAGALDDDADVRHELYDFGDLSVVMGGRIELDRAYQDALERAVTESRFSPLSRTLAGDSHGWPQKREIKTLAKDSESP